MTTRANGSAGIHDDTSTTLLPITETTIPDNVVISCPAVGFQARRACNACPDCENFRGVAEMCSDEATPWHLRYVIRCAHVMERRTHCIDVIET